MEREEKTEKAAPKGRLFLRTAEVVCILLALFFGALSLLAFFFLCADAAAEETARFVPDYEKADLREVLEKAEWTEEDYAFLYRQTGLTKAGIDELVEIGQRYRLTEFQEAFFFRGEVRHEMAAATTSHDYLTDPETGETYLAPIVPLKRGDVLVSSSCHTFGWRNGHAALVVGESGSVLESVTLGQDSEITYEGDEWFREASNFMVLRLKGTTDEERAAIAEDASDRLFGVPYSITVGIFSKKDQCANGAEPSATHCSHLVWQAFKTFGYDIDTDGGPVCTTRDIANCPLFEVLQVYGFDTEKLW